MFLKLFLVFIKLGLVAPSVQKASLKLLGIKDNQNTIDTCWATFFAAAIISLLSISFILGE